MYGHVCLCVNFMFACVQNLMFWQRMVSMKSHLISLHQLNDHTCIAHTHTHTHTHTYRCAFDYVCVCVCEGKGWWDENTNVDII